MAPRTALRRLPALALALLPVAAGCPGTREGASPPGSPQAPAPASPTRASPAEDQAAAAAEGRAFAVDLFRTLAAAEGNLFFSPLSISTALTMTAAGARGDTAAEMTRTLHLALPAERVHAAHGNVLARLLGGGRPFSLALANRLWGRLDVDFRPEFLATTRECYGAGLERLDFKGDAEGSRQTINAWVSDQTLGKVQELLGQGSVTPETGLVLTNAIYFKGSWAERFPEEATRERPFTLASGERRPTRMMHQTAEFGFAQLEGLKLLEMPYEGGALSMVVVLPDAHDGLSALTASLDLQTLDGWISRLGEREVEVAIPRFELEAAFDLQEPLQALGTVKAFQRGVADFSAMAAPRPGEELVIWISKVLHKACVDVNEEGTEAAAATAVVVDIVAESVPEPPPSFVADHPFLFLIRDRQTGAVLFMGRLATPTS